MATHSADPGTHTEVLPMFTEVSPGFDTVMRGYDRGQVDSYLLRVDADVRAANNERQNAMARNADGQSSRPLILVPRCPPTVPRILMRRRGIRDRA